jgi:hypothetical protein
MRRTNLLLALLMVVTAVTLGSLPVDAIAREISARMPGSDATSGASSGSATSLSTHAFIERQIPIDVSARVTRNVIKKGDPIPLEITIHNGLAGPVDFKSFNLNSNDWNGETPSIALYNFYRGRREEGLFLGRPSVEPPIVIPAMPWHRIEPGKALKVNTDVSKWTIADGWLPGKYKVALRIDNLQVDGYAGVSIAGEPFEFEIKN